MGERPVVFEVVITNEAYAKLRISATYIARDSRRNSIA